MTLKRIVLLTAMSGFMSPVAMAATAEESAAAAAESAAAAAESATAAAESAAAAAESATAAAESAAAAAESAAGASTESATTATAGELAGPMYKVVDGKVDKPTFNGYRRFHGTCHACHGQDAAGGSFAPSLVESLKVLEYDAFVKTVLEGRQVSSSSGGTSAMPGFANDPNITKHLDDIYVYLKARSDGVLGTGRPAKLPKPK